MKSEVFDDVFANKNNMVTLNLGDYEAIKKENEVVIEDNNVLREKLSVIYSLFAKARVPEEFIKDIESRNVEVSFIDTNETADPMSAKKALIIKSTRQYR